MQTFLLYMIKSSTILIVLLTYYQFFLKRQTFFNLNRIFLLGVLVLSALLPFISIEINRNDMIGFPTLASVSELLEENQIGKSSQSTLITATEQPIPMIPLLYGIGVVFFFLRYLTTLCRLCLFVHRNPRKRLHGLYMIQIQEGLPTFSFFNYLFINTHSLSQENRRKIFAHEKIHIQQCHSLDLCIAEIICIANWFNPFVWLIKQLILENHEYIADQQVIRKYKISGYLELLIQQSLKGAFSFTNYFSCSNLKKRTIMLTKKQSRKFQMINYIPAFLLAGMLFYLFSCKNMCEEPESPELQVFQIVENMPQFSGDLSKWATQNIKYPSKAIEAGIEGKVYVNFIIDSTGRVGHAEIQRSTQSLLNAEALKGIEAMPDWIPGKQRGKAVRVIYTLPVTFSLKDQAGNFAPKVTIIPPHNEAKTPTLVKDSSETENSTEVCIFQVVEEMPEFAEGNVAEWIMKNIKYPKEAIEANITGKVFVQFVIEKDGSITNAKIARSASTLMDAEALRIVNNMPQWIPGKQRGKAVRVAYTLPISFSLE